MEMRHMIGYYHRPVGNNGFLNRCQDIALRYGGKLKYSKTKSLDDLEI